ncbi:hypothetical protein [Lichenicoccus roseus]|uniref:hypothetical protein n=1 Tax=Lichenicoccus roseus TaxID=2683649 RepID=UPI0014864A47|nr:hypothetical protein [Lichenicoccus roseus]
MRPSRHALALALNLALLGLLAACGDPYQRPGTWQAEGVNDANLKVEATNKSDFIAGHGDAGSDGTLDAAAVDRLHQDKARKLTIDPTSSLAGGGS